VQLEARTDSAAVPNIMICPALSVSSCMINTVTVIVIVIAFLLINADFNCRRSGTRSKQNTNVADRLAKPEGLKLSFIELKLYR
jgi:hypothetical protein